MKCRECQGKGWILVAGDSEMAPQPDQKLECDHCLGTGEEPPAPIEYECPRGDRWVRRREVVTITEGNEPWFWTVPDATVKLHFANPAMARAWVEKMIDAGLLSPEVEYTVEPFEEEDCDDLV